MNRRNFLSGSLALIGAAGLPKAMRKDQDSATIYKTNLSPNNPGQRYYEMAIYHAALYNFTKAPAHTRSIQLTIKYFDTADLSSPKNSGVYKYTITNVSSVDGIYTAKAKFDEKLSGNHSFEKTFPRNLTLKVDTFSYVEIKGKNNKSLVTIPYPSTLSDDDLDCFLTGACVHHRQLPDNCVELSTLRKLRDGYMALSPAGRQIIGEYESIGPRIVRAIHHCENRSEIYEYMYQHLVLPSVALVQAGENQQAVDYYEQFVRDLKAKYF